MTTQTRNSRGQFTKSVINETIDDVYDKYESIFEGLIPRYPLAGAIVNVVVTGLGVYTGMQFAGYIAVAVVLMTSSTFLGLLIGLIAAVISLIQALRFGAVASRWVSSGQFEYDYQRAKSYVLGWFKKDEVSHV